MYFSRVCCLIQSRPINLINKHAANLVHKFHLLYERVVMNKSRKLVSKAYYYHIIIPEAEGTLHSYRIQPSRDSVGRTAIFNQQLVTHNK